MEKKHSILVIDDEKANIITLRHMLGNDYKLYAAKTGFEGLALAKKHVPDLILLDIMMPVMNGYEVYMILKNSEKTQNIPVIFISGLTDEDNVEKGMALGVVDYITKPFKSYVVKLRVENQLKLKAQSEQTAEEGN